MRHQLHARRRDGRVHELQEQHARGGEALLLWLQVAGGLGLGPVCCWSLEFAAWPLPLSAASAPLLPLPPHPSPTPTPLLSPSAASASDLLLAAPRHLPVPSLFPPHASKITQSRSLKDAIASRCQMPNSAAPAAAVKKPRAKAAPKEPKVGLINRTCFCPARPPQYLDKKSPTRSIFHAGSCCQENKEATEGRGGGGAGQQQRRRSRRGAWRRHRQRCR